MKKMVKWLTLAAAAAVLPAGAEVKELSEFVPDAKDYELIYQFDPIQYHARGYQVDNGNAIQGTLTKVGYFLALTGKDGKTTWVFASMDPFHKTLDELGVPFSGMSNIQTYVNNLEVLSNSQNVKTGKFAKGNVEFTANNYSGDNAMKIPGATKAFDFGDSLASSGGYGCLQIHNYLEKQTVLAFNNLKNTTCDLGIGNAPGGNTDWTFSASGKKYKSAKMLVVGKFQDFKKVAVKKIDTQKITLNAATSEKKFVYAPGEKMNFVFTMKDGGQNFPQDSQLIWTRTGDDGKRSSGRLPISNSKTATITTQLDQPGFVRIQAQLADSKGRVYQFKNNGRFHSIVFDGGAGVGIDKLKAAAEEPADFDAFWEKQKQRLAAVPVKFKMTKVSKPGDKTEVFAVSVDCAGPRPVTGYLTMPPNAKEKSLPATVTYHGYGTSVQKAPKSGWGNIIRFDINAHGYDLDRDAAYYKKFFDGIKSNGKIYAFDPKQNSDPEKAYFNGMALRVMRALQFVRTLPQWNGKDLSVSGGSQGGLQTVWAAALDPAVKSAAPSITWCCDFAGDALAKRLPGWRPSYVPALNYYDAVFHAKRIKPTCKVAITRAGLGDYTCPPSGLAILYNNIKGPKEIRWFQGSTHGFVPRNPEIFTVRGK